ncbi:MAG: hypothetical protein U0L72_03305, partial [Acutalibacteraceae bacterium]|nr:hypothetical protein [Acutalibacteraceae bacterium]
FVISKGDVEELQESTEADANEVNEFKEEIRVIRNKYLAGELKGEKGDKGDTGPKGEKGDKSDAQYRKLKRRSR